MNITPILQAARRGVKFVPFLDIKEYQIFRIRHTPKGWLIHFRKKLGSGIVETFQSFSNVKKEMEDLCKTLGVKYSIKELDFDNEILTSIHFDINT